jgi:hypothetical protein
MKYCQAYPGRLAKQRLWSWGLEHSARRAAELEGGGYKEDRSKCGPSMEAAKLELD